MKKFTKKFDELSARLEQRIPKAAYLYAGLAHFLNVTQLMFFKLLTERQIPYYQIIYLRSTLIIIINHFIIKAQGGHCYPRDRFTHYVLLSRMVFQGAASMLMFYGVSIVLLSDSQALQMTKPIWTILFGIVFYGEKPSILFILSVLLCVAGILCVTRPAFIFGENGEEQDFKHSQQQQTYGALAILISAILQGASQNIIRLLHKKTNSTVVTQYFTMAQLLTAPMLWVQIGKIDNVLLFEPNNIAILLLLTVVSYAGQVLISKSNLMELPSKLAPLNYTRTFYSFTFDLLIFHANIQTLSVIGNILILIGCYNIIKYE